MNSNLSYQMALTHRDELLRQAAQRRHIELPARTRKHRTTKSRARTDARPLRRAASAPPGHRGKSLA